MKTIAIAADHAGFEYKKAIIQKFSDRFHFIDFGTDSPDSVDYPDYVHPAATSVEENESDLGIVICGSGNGVAMTANKHKQIRCALCWENEIVALAKQHNNANFLAIPARYVSLDLAYEMVETFITTEFEGGRHKNRVEKIGCV